MKIKNWVIAIAAVVAAVVISGYCVDAEFRRWNDRVERALAFAVTEAARADTAVVLAAAISARADSIAAEAAARAPLIRERIRVVRDTVLLPVPDTCRPVVAQRDSIIDDLVVESDQWRVAYFEGKDAASMLLQSYNFLRTAYDSLVVVLEARPKPRSRWAPTLHVGAIAGICTTGQFCAGLGAGVGIEFKIPTPW